MTMFFLGSALAIAGLVAGIIVLFVLPLLLGAMAYDVVSSREISTAKVADTRARIAIERNVARGFVIAGGLFWSAASLAGLFVFEQNAMQGALMTALIPLVATAATLIIGWYYERVTAFLLVLATMGAVAWGVIYGFEFGLWVIVTVFLLGPMLTAATLFWLARRDQDALELALSLQPELQPQLAKSSLQ
ncbi:MAG TPA: hypothetical protein VFH17_00915 [Coriobacteriia bacterium]|nr:hypothetical protein [Coriobacteriia bacterium]